MRILWFTSTPSLAAGKLNTESNMTGWVASLEKQMSTVDDIELGVAFPFGFEYPRTFRINRTSYFSFPFWKEKGKIGGLSDRWRHLIEPENEVDYYLDIIDQFKPDLIHIFGSERSFGEIADHTSIPIVLQIQGNLSVCTLKYFSGISAADSIVYSNIKSFLLGYNTWHQFITFRKRSKREREFMKKIRFILGRTDWDRYISKIMAPGSRYFHCEEVLRDQFYSNRWIKPQHEKFTIFSTLSGSTYKGFETVLLAASILKEVNGFDFEWNIAGLEGNHEIVTITEKSRKLKFNDCNVYFKGSVNADEVAEGLLKSDCYVHPSHIENSPNSVCEAMLMGIPVVATYAGGTATILRSGVEGILVQDGDPYVLAGVLTELAASPEKSLMFSENARKTALIRHNPEAILTNLINVYRSVINT